MRLGGKVQRIASAVVSALPGGALSDTRSLETFTLIDLGIASKDALSVSIVLLILAGIVLVGIPCIAFAVAVILEHDYRVFHTGPPRTRSALEPDAAERGGAAATAPGAAGAGVEMCNPLRRDGAIDDAMVVGVAAAEGDAEKRSSAIAGTAPDDESSRAALAPFSAGSAVVKTVVASANEEPAPSDAASVAQERAAEEPRGRHAEDAEAPDAAMDDTSDDLSIDLG
jgi:hypothetical protein